MFFKHFGARWGNQSREVTMRVRKRNIKEREGQAPGWLRAMDPGFNSGLISRS